MKPEPDKALRYSRLLRAASFATPYWRGILIILLLTLIIAALNAAEPLVFKFIFDSLASHPKAQMLLAGILGLLGLGFVREISNGCSNWLTWRTRLNLQRDLLENLVDRLHRLPPSFHGTEGVGAILTKLERSIQGFIGAVSQILFNVVPALLYLVLAIAVMMNLEWRLGVMVLAFAPLPALIAALAGPEQVRRERGLFQAWSKIYSRLYEVLSGILLVRCFSMENAEKDRFVNSVQQTNQTVLRGVGRDTGFGSATNVVVSLAHISATAFGGFLILRGEITVGVLIAFLGYVGGLFGPVQGLTGVYQTLQRAYVAMDEIFSILDLPEALTDAPQARKLQRVRGEIAFDDVTFSYGPQSGPTLQNINLHVEAGETLAIVGPSGAGKSTLLALLLRFYDPQKGSIRLDGQDLRELKQKSLRHHIGVVLQEPLLFNETIRQNIVYGRPAASMAEIEIAARAAHAHDFIMRLPEGYDTVVGERGCRLSAGERQRITIARALVKNPPILVLDEAASALDAQSEMLIPEVLNTLMKGRTTFMIAHRLSTVVRADRIAVLKEGRIIEYGTHGELMRLGAYYSSLVHWQTGGLLQQDAVPLAPPQPFGRWPRTPYCSRPLDNQEMLSNT